MGLSSRDTPIRATRLLCRRVLEKGREWKLILASQIRKGFERYILIIVRYNQKYDTLFINIIAGV